jgi:hypothetical protein
VKLPRWIPQVSLPWNKAFKDTWHAMTPNERRWSFLIDIFAVAMFLFFLWVSQVPPQ